MANIQPSPNRSTFYICVVFISVLIVQTLPSTASDISSYSYSSRLSSSKLRGQKIRLQHVPRTTHLHHHHRHVKYHHRAKLKEKMKKKVKKIAVPVTTTKPTHSNNKIKIPPVLVNVGERVLVHNVLLGTVMYIGATSFAKGTWIGVSLDQPKGKNDGTVKGHKYFECEAKHGLFTKPENVIRYQQNKLSLETPKAVSSNNNNEKKKNINLVSITGKGGKEVPIESLKDLKTKYLHDLDEKMYGLMHEGKILPKKSKSGGDSFDQAVNKVVANEHRNMLKVQNAKLTASKPRQENDVPKPRNNAKNILAAPTPYVGINQPTFGAQLPPPQQQQFQPAPIPSILSQELPSFNQQLQMPLPMMFLQLSYENYLDSTAIGLPKEAKNIGSAYTLKDLEASGMNKAFEDVDTSGLPDELVDQIKAGKSAKRNLSSNNKSGRHLSDLDSMFVKMLDHNSHHKEKFSIPDKVSSKKKSDDGDY
jgi:hypothetical protein